MDIPADVAAALIQRPVEGEGPEETLRPLFAHEVFAAALNGDQLTVITIDGQKFHQTFPVGGIAGLSSEPVLTGAIEHIVPVGAQEHLAAALPESPAPGLQPAGELVSPAVPEAAGDSQDTHPADRGDVSAEPGATSVAPAPVPTPAATAVDEPKNLPPAGGKPARHARKGGAK